MMNLVTIDTGTTNTRVMLWQNGKKIAKVARPVGVKSTSITGSKDTLHQTIKSAIEELLKTAQVELNSDVKFIASGMITSNLGLAEIPHQSAPVSMSDVAANMEKILIPEVCSQPIWFVPGVKNSVRIITSENIDQMDVMRGEEVEAFGALTQLQAKKPFILVLPGSHTKFIKIDEDGKIAGSITSMAGELISLLTKDSILSDSLEHNFSDELDIKALTLGAENCAKKGLGRAAFTVRLLDLYTNYTRNQMANYLLGVVLQNDVSAIKTTQAFDINVDDTFIVIGKPALRDALQVLLNNDDYFTGNILTIDVPELASVGIMAIAKMRNII
ncbi:MAG: 2-dehydro-3-deoxygalactonokinase [Weissella hellenica]|uniref:2-dehydro-3-deoxygalactonokinase n=1 Tax=Weissella hellenica TaxID=46256 RepID=UPI003886A0A6